MTQHVPSDSQQEVLRKAFSRLVSLSDAAWSAAWPLFASRHFTAGEHVVKAGTVVTEMFFLTSGLARYYYLDAQGREFNKSFSTQGQALSSVYSLVTGKPSPFFVQAMLPSEALGIRYADFSALTIQYGEWSAVRARLLEELVIKKERREADFLLLSAGERYAKFLQEHAHVAELIPNYHVASYLGITEVALSRIRRRLGLTRVNAGKEK